jgi:hypothetical protein
MRALKRWNRAGLARIWIDGMAISAASIPGSAWPVYSIA